MQIIDIIKQRNISEIVHFTSNHGLVGALEIGKVLSRRQLPDEKHLSFLAAPTSSQRQEAMSYFNKDEDWLDFVNLSISEINYHYYNIASTKWHVQGDRWWTILVFSSDILAHDGVFFTTTNNVYECVQRGEGVVGLNALFEQIVPRKSGWSATRRQRPNSLPTCQQAEVLYPQSLSISYLVRIYVATEEQSDIVSGWLRQYQKHDIEVVIKPQKFKGVPN